MRIVERSMPAAIKGAMNIEAPWWQAALEHLGAALVLVGVEAVVVVFVRTASLSGWWGMIR
ncbi:MAG: hypothetical protein JST93_01785 [Acidobacteria bacterium]|nr:hypothetical protein [Acidobacteriota bacterium]